MRLRNAFCKAATSYLTVVIHMHKSTEYAVAYKLHTFSHENFVDHDEPDTHTQNVENMWMRAKRKIRRQFGTVRELFLHEFMWCNAMKGRNMFSTGVLWTCVRQLCHACLVVAQLRQHLPTDGGLQLNVPQRKKHLAPQSGRPSATSSDSRPA